ncbi:hypothetical protein Cgig2_001461 [Carnegiea gigantea]|uniref:Protein phosphatase n=1 Tax=Carnegiea gigantea TaxID=171969 RepID=A0A9Q1QRN1_9CARY|nr:hypothetical protein Cgig2_001461 [Carnegiea gigantea]
MAGPGVYYFFPTDYFVPPLYSTTPNHKDLLAPATRPQIKTADDHCHADHDGDQRLRMKDSRKLVIKRKTSNDCGILSDCEIRCVRQRLCAEEETDTSPTKEQKKLKLVAGACYIPKDDESHPKGDDAYFICAEKQTIGVADGVGGWRLRGIDAGAYARELMANCTESALLVPVGCLIDPMKVLAEGHSKTNANAKGSSTACIITLQHNVYIYAPSLLHSTHLDTSHMQNIAIWSWTSTRNQPQPSWAKLKFARPVLIAVFGQYLCAANLGDSGFVVLREGKVFYRSPVQQHKFNQPYQLGNGNRFDSPRTAMQIRVPVKPGDIIVAGTDGLFDNMFNHELEEIVKDQEECSTPEDIAWYIAENALYDSLDKDSETPFSTASKKAGKTHQGGKIDDITAVVALVQPADH